MRTLLLLQHAQEHDRAVQLMGNTFLRAAVCRSSRPDDRHDRERRAPREHREHRGGRHDERDHGPRPRGYERPLPPPPASARYAGLCEMATGVALDKAWRSHFLAGQIFSVQVCHMLSRSAPVFVVFKGS